MTKQAFKFLHTADWHLGCELEHQSLADEHANYIDRLSQVCREERPDALLIAGDIYDTATPGSEVQNFFFSALVKLHEACRSMQIIVMPGNHDSAARLAVGRDMMRTCNTSIVKKIGQGEESAPRYQDQVVEVRNPEGQLLAYVAAVPYINTHYYPRMEGADTPTARQTAYFAGLADYVGQLAQEEPAHTVLMAHLPVRRQRKDEEGVGREEEKAWEETGDERDEEGEGPVEAAPEAEPDDTQVEGKLEVVDAGTLGRGWDYAALGHLHRPHTCTPDGRVAYPGSAVAVSFDEPYAHPITLVRLDKDGGIRTTTFENPPLHRLVTIPPQGTQQKPKGLPFDQALQLLKDYKGEGDYLRLNIVPEKKAAQNPAKTKKTQEIAQERGNKLLKINYVLEEADLMEAIAGMDALTVDKFRDLDPLKVAKDYFGTKKLEWTQALEDAMRQVMDEIDTQEHERESGSKG